MAVSRFPVGTRTDPYLARSAPAMAKGTWSANAGTAVTETPELQGELGSHRHSARMRPARRVSCEVVGGKHAHTLTRSLCRQAAIQAASRAE